MMLIIYDALRLDRRPGQARRRCAGDHQSGVLAAVCAAGCAVDRLQLIRQDQCTCLVASQTDSACCSGVSCAFRIHCVQLSHLEHGFRAYLPHRRISCTYTCVYMTGMCVLAAGCAGLSEYIAPGAGRGRRCAQEGYCMESNAGPALSAGMVLAA